MSRLFLPLLLCLTVTISLQLHVDYSGYKLVRFKVNEKTSKWLAELEEDGFDFDKENQHRRLLIDIWGEPSVLSPYADVLVAPEFFDTFTSILRTEGVKKIQILKKDIQNDFRKELREMRTHARLKRFIQSSSDFNAETYHSYNDMVDYMKALAREHPDLVTLITIGSTSEMRTIYGVKIATGPGSKPAIFVDAGIHAREWIAPAAALYMIKKLVTQYGSDSKVTRTLDKFDWYIVPQANPDGYEYSRLSDRLWRKTRSRNTTVNRWCFGADANRNWGYRWGEAGANRQPCSNIYAGSHPFSEPEITGLKDYLTWQIPQLVVYTSLHAYGQLLLAPWGFTTSKTNNFMDQRNAARAAVNAIRNTTGASYNQGTISELMYPASGTSIDYMQDKGVPYIYGIELRPLDSVSSYGFSLPSLSIKPTGEETLAGLIAIGDYAIIHKRL